MKRTRAGRVGPAEAGGKRSKRGAGNFKILPVLIYLPSLRSQKFYFCHFGLRGTPHRHASVALAQKRPLCPCSSLHHCPTGQTVSCIPWTTTTATRSGHCSSSSSPTASCTVALFFLLLAAGGAAAALSLFYRPRAPAIVVTAMQLPAFAPSHPVASCGNARLGPRLWAPVGARGRRRTPGGSPCGAAPGAGARWQRRSEGHGGVGRDGVAGLEEMRRRQLWAVQRRRRRAGIGEGT